MQLDPTLLRRQYASLSDDALLAIEPDELVDSARAILQEELVRRHLSGNEPEIGGEKPEWLEEAAEACSYAVLPGGGPAQGVTEACQALEHSDIPYYLEEYETQPEENASRAPRQYVRVMVPGSLSLRATSVMERDIFNQEFEAIWQTQLDTMTDAEVLEMTPEFVFCGLFDRIERAERIYREELERRRLTP